MNNEVVSNIKEFILGGRAEFTIIQDSTDKRKEMKYKYRISAADGRYADGKPYVWYIKAEPLRGGNPVYQGYIRRDSLSDWTLTFYRGNNVSSEDFNANAVNGLMWVLRHSDKLPEVVHILHHGKCSACGRKLTDAESLRCGIGPTCRQKVFG